MVILWYHKCQVSQLFQHLCNFYTFIKFTTLQNALLLSKISLIYWSVLSTLVIMAKTEAGVWRINKKESWKQASTATGMLLTIVKFILTAETPPTNCKYIANNPYFEICVVTVQCINLFASGIKCRQSAFTYDILFTGH